MHFITFALMKIQFVFNLVYFVPLVVLL